MGGHAFAQAVTESGAPTLRTPRMTPAEYSHLKAVYRERLKTLLPGCEVESLIEAPEKPDYGDLDLIVCSDQTHDLPDLAQQVGARAILVYGSDKDQRCTLAVPKNGCKCEAPVALYKPSHGNVPAQVQSKNLSEEEYAQIDIRFLTPESFEWYAFYASYGDLAALLGRLARPLGFTVSDKGLWLRLQELDDSKDVKWLSIPDKDGYLLLSSDPGKIMAFFGLSAERYWEGFQSMEDFYKWLAECRFISPEIIQIKRDDHNERQKERKRTVYSRFLREWLPARLETDSETTKDVTPQSEHDAEPDFTSKRAELCKEAAEIFAKTEEYAQMRRALILGIRNQTAERLIKPIVAIHSGKADRKLTEVMRAFRRWIVFVDGSPQMGETAHSDGDAQLHHWLDSDFASLENEDAANEWQRGHPPPTTKTATAREKFGCFARKPSSPFPALGCLPHKDWSQCHPPPAHGSLPMANTTSYRRLRDGIHHIRSSLLEIPSAVRDIPTAFRPTSFMDNIFAEANRASIAPATFGPPTSELRETCTDPAEAPSSARGDREAPDASRDQLHSNPETFTTSDMIPEGVTNTTIPETAGEIAQAAAPESSPDNHAPPILQDGPSHDLPLPPVAPAVPMCPIIVHLATGDENESQRASTDISTKPDMGLTASKISYRLQQPPDTQAHAINAVATPVLEMAEPEKTQNTSNAVSPEDDAPTPFTAVREQHPENISKGTNIAENAPLEISDTVGAPDHQPDTDRITVPQIAAPATDAIPPAEATAGATQEESPAGRDRLQTPVNIVTTVNNGTNVAQASAAPTVTKPVEPADLLPPEPDSLAAILIDQQVVQMKKPAPRRKTGKNSPAPKRATTRQPARAKVKAKTCPAQPYERAPNARRVATAKYRVTPPPPTPRPRAQRPTARDRQSLIVKLPISLSPAQQTPNTSAKRKRLAEDTQALEFGPDNKRHKQSEEVLAVDATPFQDSSVVEDAGQQNFSDSHGQESVGPTAASLEDAGIDVNESQHMLPFNGVRPKRDVLGDEKFVEDVKKVLEARTKKKARHMGWRQAIRILDLLERAKYPTEDEARFLSTEEAMEAVRPKKFWNNIIITEGQQTLPLQSVDDFLGEYYDDDTEVWIQDPAIRPSSQPVTRKVKMKKIKDRFAGTMNSQPWNLLELATHCDDGLRPLFLNTEDCRLLTKLKIPNSEDEARRKTYAPGYKEVEKWALLAQAGALTEPHQDSHGYSTYITVNVGLVGFGWLCAPTAEERAAWRKYPMTFTEGNWRYVVLKPGQTVYFPAGTVHFVFRLPAAGNTLAFGGHVLRCSNIVHWVQTLIEERDEKNVTNEDLTDSSSGYLHRVEKFVKRALTNGQAEKWGGQESIEQFLTLKAKFEEKKQK
ncbi:Hypothetical predicted protein [Lecanosticta acicola]|uniref:JmjC domain-containing protein n=1 Tax=Lecanosticta acicola TaxID=111012 RepID=A0AAI8YT05_9PEZI|nr:Hypothetical predicted protein [Lecanosticta acicola]